MATATCLGSSGRGKAIDSHPHGLNQAKIHQIPSLQRREKIIATGIVTGLYDIEVVDAAERSHQAETSIQISVRDRYLTLLDDGHVISKYPVAIGAPESPTPAGKPQNHGRDDVHQAAWAKRLLRIAALGKKAIERHGWIELWEGETLKTRLELGEGRVRIGRDPCCELKTDVNSFSRVHAFVEKVRAQDRDWVLEDFGSANGVFWRDRRIRRISLRHGDAIQL